MNKIIEIEKRGWVLTDDDCYQWQRFLDPITLLKTEMVQIVEVPDKGFFICNGVVDLEDATYDELEELVKLYGYSDLDAFVVETSPTTEFVYDTNGKIDRDKSASWILEYPLLAEMKFETNFLSYIANKAYQTFDAAQEAVDEILMKG